MWNNLGNIFGEFDLHFGEDFQDKTNLLNHHPGVRVRRVARPRLAGDDRRPGRRLGCRGGRRRVGAVHGPRLVVRVGGVGDGHDVAGGRRLRVVALARVVHLRSGGQGGRAGRLRRVLRVGGHGGRRVGHARHRGSGNGVRASGTGCRVRVRGRLVRGVGHDALGSHSVELDVDCHCAKGGQEKVLCNYTQYLLQGTLKLRHVLSLNLSKILT